MLRVACAVVAVLLCGCAAPAARSYPPSSRSALLDRPVPEFRRATVQGGSVSSEALRGRVWVVEFFAMWCKPCLPRLAAAKRLQAEFPDVQIVGLSVDDLEEDAVELVRRHRLQFPVVHDDGVALTGRFRVTELPTVVVIARDGRVAWVGGPEQPEQNLRLVVRALREEPPRSTP